MSANRVRVAKDKADLVKSLTESDGKTGPFQTYADVMVFAATVGFKKAKRVPIAEVSKREPGPIGLEIFISRGYELVMKLLAISEAKNPNILSPTDVAFEESRILIFEEYANGGLEILRDELRGAADYTERILLMLMAERFQEEASQDSFDLRKFLG